MIASITEETDRRNTLLDADYVVGRLNRKLTGWANYFCLGPVSPAYRRDAGSRKLRCTQRLLRYKALVTLASTDLEVDGRRYPLSAGMQTNAEIMLGRRTVAEYLLSPVRRAWHEAGRER